jgi:hypothetical protein
VDATQTHCAFFSSSFSSTLKIYHRSRVRRNLLLFSALYEALRREESASVSVASSTASSGDLQEKLEALKIVERVVETPPNIPATPSKKKHYSKKDRRALERRHARALEAAPMHTRSISVYVAGKAFALLREFPLLGAIVEAFAQSVVHQGGPCVLHIRRGIFLAPPRFGLDVPTLEKAFDTFREMAKPIPGTDIPGSSTHDTASIRLSANETVTAGRASLVTKRLMKTLRAFDDFGMYTLRVIAGCLTRWSLLGFAASANAENLLQVLKHVFANPKALQEKKHVLAVFYKPNGVLEGHIDPTEVATFITTRTPNDDRETLLNIADMDCKKLKYTIGYHRWDVVFFPANVYHQTSAYPEEREIMNLFY